MKVFLLQSVPGLGRDGEVKEVAVGYARNFLFPKHFATPATPFYMQKAAQLRRGRKSHEERKQRQQQQAEQVLEGRVVTVLGRATSLGNLYAAIPAKEIVASIMKETGVRVGEKDLLSPPIKTLGQHEISVRRKDRMIRMVVEVKPERAVQPSSLKA